MDLNKVFVSRLKNHRSSRYTNYSLSSIFNEIKLGRTTIHHGWTSQFTGTTFKAATLQTIKQQALNLKHKMGQTKHKIKHFIPQPNIEIRDAYYYQCKGKENTAYFVDSHAYSSYLGAYTNLKVDSPAFIPAGVVDSSRRVISSSSVLCLEFDNIANNKTKQVMELCQEVNQTLACFTTLSDNGIAILVVLDKPQVMDEQHHAAWFAASTYYMDLGELLNEPKLKPDIKAARFGQPRSIVFDPNLIVNEQAKPINWSKDYNANLIGFNAIKKQDQLDSESNNKTNLWTDNKVIHNEAASFDSLGLSYQLFFKDYSFRYGSEETINQWQSYKIPCPWNQHEHDDSELDLDQIGSTSNRNATAFMPIENGYKLRCFKCDMMGDFLKEDKNYLIIYAERKLNDLGYTYTKEKYLEHILLNIKCPIQNHKEQEEAFIIQVRDHLAFYCNVCNKQNLLFDQLLKYIN